MLYYHASPTPGIEILEPRVSNHGTPLVYVSQKRENVLVYLSNAVEKFCHETGFVHDGPYYKWASYGFTKEGVLQLEEYWPGALEDTYAGVQGYIYTVPPTDALQPMQDIPAAYSAAQPLPVCGCEQVPDALEAIIAAETADLVRIRRYEQLSENTHRWLAKVIPQDFAANGDHPEYQAFLRAKFPALF